MSSLSFKKHPVSLVLQPFVKYYYSLKGSSGEFFETHPQGTLDLIFGDMTGNEFLGEKKKKVTSNTRIGMFAQQEKHFDLYVGPNTRFYGIAFYPEGFYKILNFPLGEMVDFIWDLTDFLPKSFQFLAEQVLECDSDECAIQKMEAFFLQEFQKANAIVEPFDKLLHLIRQKHGALSVEEMTKHLFVSRRTLNRLFADRLGIRPKSYSSIVRFQKAILNYYARPDFGWSAISYDTGYYDQNHFIKDFRRYTGKTPTLFLDADRTLSDFFLKE